jgi:hypothetical protein
MNTAVQLKREDGTCVVQSGHWTVRHNLRKGGCVDDVRILYGTNTNLLRKLSEAVLNDWREGEDPSPEMTVFQDAEALTLTFQGFLGGPQSGVRYTHSYRYTPWSIKHELTIEPPASLRVRRFTPGVLAFCDVMKHYNWGTADPKRTLNPNFGRVYQNVVAGVPEQPACVEEDHDRPWTVGLMQRGIQGFQWAGDSHQYAWDSLAKGKSYRLERTREGTDLELWPVDDAAGVTLGKTTLGWYWFLPNVPRLGKRRYYEMNIYSEPFPSEEKLDRWKERGVDLLRLQVDWDGQNYDPNNQNTSDDYWHDGMHPPFKPEKMRRLRQVIDAAHARGMKIITYFSGWELAPDTPLFAQHAQEWYAAAWPRGNKRYSTSGNGGIYGCLMCPDTPWIDALERNIRAAIDELGFDGFYLDWSQPVPCGNLAHLPGPHNGIDGLVSLTERLRRHIPEGVIVFSCGGGGMWVHPHNIGDQWVTFEEGKGNPDVLEDYPATVDYMGVGTVSAVPQTLMGGDLEKLHRGLVRMALLGFPPYGGDCWYDHGWGYPDWKAFADDPWGVLGVMKRYSQYDWTRYHFYPAPTGVTHSSSAQVGAAVYLGDGEGLVLAGNLKKSPAPASTATVDLEKTLFGTGKVEVKIPAMEGWTWQFVPFRF